MKIFKPERKFLFDNFSQIHKINSYFSNVTIDREFLQTEKKVIVPRILFNVIHLMANLRTCFY